MTTQIATFKSEQAINIMKVVGGVLAIAASSQMSIPMKPVPITFQTMVAMIIGLTYSPKLVMSTMATYLSMGAIGLPVFSNLNGGLPYLMGATGGYLVALFVSPAFMAYFQQYFGSNTIKTLCNCLLGSLIIYALGITWLSQFIGLEKAFYSGFVVFIPTGIAKIVLLTVIMRFIKK